MLTPMFIKAVSRVLRGHTRTSDNFTTQGREEKPFDDGVAGLVIYLLLIPVAVYFVSGRSDKVLTYAVIFADPLAYLVSSSIFRMG